MISRRHFLGWAGEVDADELFASGRAWGITLAPGANLFVTEQAGQRVRRVHYLGGDPTQATSYAVSDVAGSTTGAPGYVDGQGSAARFFAP